MKNPFKSPPSFDAVYNAIERRLTTMLVDRDSELRQLFARIARGEAKNFFALHLGTELEKFERELEQRSARALASLGSASPTLDQHVSTLPGLTCVKCTLPIREHTSPAGKILCPDADKTIPMENL